MNAESKLPASESNAMELATASTTIIARRNAFGPNLYSGMTTASLSALNDAGHYYFTKNNEKKAAYFCIRNAGCKLLIPRVIQSSLLLLRL